MQLVSAVLLVLLLLVVTLPYFLHGLTRVSLLLPCRFTINVSVRSASNAVPALLTVVQFELVLAGLAEGLKVGSVYPETGEEDEEMRGTRMRSMSYLPGLVDQRKVVDSTVGTPYELLLAGGAGGLC